MSAARLWAAVGSTIVALTLAGGAVSAPAWIAPIPLTAADRVLEADLAIAPTGEAVAIWDREVGTVCADQPANPACVHVVEVRSRAAGASEWRAPAEIARPGVGAAPRVAVGPTGDAVAIWSHDIGADRVLQASLRPASTGVWQEPVDLSEPTSSIGSHAVALDGRGDAIAAWADAGGVKAEVRPAASGVWSAPVNLSGPDVSALAGPSLAVDAAGDAVVVWSKAGTVQTSFQSRASGTWIGAVGLGSGSDPRVGVDAAGDAVAVWTDSGAVRAATWTSATGVWGGPAALGPGTQPVVAVDVVGDAVVAWTRAGAVQASFLGASSATWTAPAELGPGAEPQVALARGNAVALWVDDGIHAALRPVASGAWLRPAAISGSGASKPQVETDGSAETLALWSRGAAVEVAELGGSGPVVSLSAPSAGVVGVPLELAVEAVPWAAPLAGDPTWTFDDGGSATGSPIRHTFASAGTYAVAVTQRDAAGGTTTAVARVTIAEAKPANLVRPSVRGRARVGSSLTCLRGRWIGTPPIRYAYWWLRSSRPIPAARRSTYRIRPRDAGTLLSCRVVASNAAGSRAASSKAVRVRRRLSDGRRRAQ